MYRVSSQTRTKTLLTATLICVTKKEKKTITKIKPAKLP